VKGDPGNECVNRKRWVWMGKGKGSVTDLIVCWGVGLVPSSMFPSSAPLRAAAAAIQTVVVSKAAGQLKG